MAYAVRLWCPACFVSIVTGEWLPGVTHPSDGIDSANDKAFCLTLCRQCLTLPRLCVPVLTQPSPLRLVLQSVTDSASTPTDQSHAIVAITTSSFVYINISYSCVCLLDHNTSSLASTHPPLHRCHVSYIYIYICLLNHYTSDTWRLHFRLWLPYVSLVYFTIQCKVTSWRFPVRPHLRWAITRRANWQ